MNRTLFLCLPLVATAIVNQIASDMRGRNEGSPHGVPRSYRWAHGPALGLGNHARDAKALSSWGVVYEARAGSTTPGVRVNIRRMRTWLLRKSSRKWVLLQDTSTPEAIAFREDFADGVSKPADLRRETDGTTSVTAGHGYNVRFYPKERASVDSEDITGIVVLIEARLLTDDHGKARYLCGVGADYYPALTGNWPAGKKMKSAGSGKLKYVTPWWRSFAMTTMSAEELETSPPPIHLRGVLR